MIDSWTFTLPLLTPSQNTWQRLHWASQSKLLDQCRQWLRFKHAENGRAFPRYAVADPKGIKACAAHVNGSRCTGSPVMVDKRRCWWCEAHAQQIPYFERRKVHVVRMSSGRLDHGNLVGGCKALLDALVLEGFLWDDGEEFCEDSYEQKSAERGKGQTVVSISRQ